MGRPRLLDLFCGAGGAGMGYHRAGFEVVGVDIEPQPHYPFEFHQADALTFPLEGFDAIHASPPCQAYSAANHIHGRTDHPQLIEPTRSVLVVSGLPYVIENVVGAPLWNHIMLCGRSFGLNVRRHRLFESNVYFGLVPPCGSHATDYVIVFGGAARGRCRQVGRTAKDGPVLRRPYIGHDVASAAMGIDWMNADELSQAIPPAYTEWIGTQLLSALAAA